MKPTVPVLLFLLPAAAGLPAAVPVALDPYIPFERHPDLFFESSVDKEGWGTTTGWVHWHWVGPWEASGEAEVSTLWVISSWADPQLRLPSVLDEMTYGASEDGLALLRRRSITAEIPDEISDMPPGSWVLPLPLEAGRTWTTETEPSRTWACLVSTEAASPNMLLSPGPCLETLSVAAERRRSGAIIVDIARAWWAPGVGPVRFEMAHGAPGGLDWATLHGERLGAVAASAEALGEHAILTLVPPAP